MRHFGLGTRWPSERPQAAKPAERLPDAKDEGARGQRLDMIFDLVGGIVLVIAFLLVVALSAQPIFGAVSP